MHEGADHTATSHTKGMAESNGTTLGVELLLGNAEGLDTVRGLGGKGLVDFKDINVVNAKTTVLEGGGDGVSRADSHHLRGHTGGGEAHNATDDFATKTVGNISTGEKDAGSSISDLRRVTGCSSSILLEGGLQLGKTCDSSSWSNTIIFVDSDAGLVAIFILHDS